MNIFIEDEMDLLVVKIIIISHKMLSRNIYIYVCRCRWIDVDVDG